MGIYGSWFMYGTNLNVASEENIRICRKLELWIEIIIGYRALCIWALTKYTYLIKPVHELWSMLGVFSDREGFKGNMGFEVNLSSWSQLHLSDTRCRSVLPLHFMTCSLSISGYKTHWKWIKTSSLDLAVVDCLCIYPWVSIHQYVLAHKVIVERLCHIFWIYLWKTHL